MQICRPARQAGAQVKLALVRGNHDRLLGLAAALATGQRFHDTAGVKMLRVRERIYESYGQHLLCFTHGDMAERQLKKLPQTALAKARHMLAEVSWVSVFTDHLHETELVMDAADFKRFRCPVSKPTDAYKRPKATSADARASKACSSSTEGTT